MRKVLVAAIIVSCCATLIPLATGTSAMAAKATPVCSFSELEVAVSSPTADMGSVGMAFIIANTSKATCTLRGYPRLIFTPSRYRSHSIKVKHDVGMIFSNVTSRLVTIRPGRDASFGFNFGEFGNQNDPSGGPCLVRDVYVTLPVRVGTFNENFGMSVNFNFCFADFQVGVTAIQAGPLPKQG
jgi:hypothetical protein